MKRFFVLPSLLLSASAVCDAPAEVVVYGEASHNAFLPVLRELEIGHRVLPLAKLGGGVPECDAVLAVAGEYPRELALDEAAQEAIRAALGRGIGVYVEFAPMPEFASGPPADAGYERILVPEGNEIGGLAPLTLLEEHQSKRFPVDPPEDAQVLLAYGRAAGFDTAVFGAPKELEPALVRIPQGTGQLFYAATALSNAVRGRYKPTDVWQRVLRGVVLAVLPKAKRSAVTSRFIELRAWTEPREWVRPGEPVRIVAEGAEAAQLTARCPVNDPIAFQRQADGQWHSKELRLPEGRHVIEVTAVRDKTVRNVELTLTVAPRAERYRYALERNMAWFRDAKMLVAPDGSRGVREGARSPIRPDGTQPVAGCIRVDCVSECALMFYLYGRLTQSAEWEQIGRRMMDYTATRFLVDSKDTWYFGDWQSRGEYDPDGTTYVFNDDSGVALTMCFAFHYFTGDEKYLLPALRSTEYFRRIASEETAQFARTGHRNWKGSSAVGVPWAKRRASVVKLANPHQMSWAQEGMLYAYAATGDEQYLDLAERSIRYTMEHYEDWHICTSRSCEHVRMLAPLALLYRYRPTPEVKEWLDKVVDFIAGKQDACGAILEWDGKSPQSNEAFGTAETSIFQRNGDPVSDQLYNTGFALLHLWMAHKITGEARLREMFERLADYLVRIQIRSDYKLLDGTWMRAFDFGRWEYFGSSADVGWGPYCIETGWSVAPIDLGLILYLMDSDAAPTGPGGSPEITALRDRIVQEFDEVKRTLSAPPPKTVAGLRVVSSKGHMVALQWERPKDGAATSYRVYQGKRAGFALADAAVVARPREESCLLVNLGRDTDYWYRVVAESAAGQRSEPSNEVKAHTGGESLARGKPYVKSVQPFGGYPDANEAESTDGTYAGPYADGRSYGYRIEEVGKEVTVEVTVDLQDVQQVSRASHHACGNPGYAPDRMAVETSADGKAWQERGATAERRDRFLVLDFAPTPARYVKFRFRKRRDRAGADWLFIDELEVF